MKSHIILAGIFGQLLITGALAAQDTTRTTTTTTITHDTTIVTGDVPAPPPAPPAPSDDESYSNDNDNDGPAPAFYFGARYMPTFSSFDIQTVNGNAETSFNVSNGYSGYIGTDFNKHVGLQLEVIYNELSQKYTYQAQDNRVNLNYVNIPLMLVLNTNVNAPVNFNITAGPQIGINTGSSLHTSGSNGNENVQAVLAVKPMDFGLAYGAGFDFNLGKSITLDLGFRGVYGLVDISDHSKTRSTSQYLVLDKTNINTYAGYVGLRFNIR